jgi:excisionase family DNA binding protein
MDVDEYRKTQMFEGFTFIESLLIKILYILENGELPYVFRGSGAIRLYTPEDIAKICRVSLQTVYRWTGKGKIKFYPHKGRRGRSKNYAFEDELRHFLFSHFFWKNPYKAFDLAKELAKDS